MITFSKKALSKLRKESRPRAASLKCSTSQGAGTQHPIHFSCAPARSHTITANSKASATRQTTSTTKTQQKQTHFNPQPQAPAGREKPRGGYGACAAVGFKGNPHFNHATTRPVPPRRRSLAPAPGCCHVWRRGVPPGVGASVSPAPRGCAADGASSSPPPHRFALFWSFWLAFPSQDGPPGKKNLLGIQLESTRPS